MDRRGAGMAHEAARLMPALFHGWVELLGLWLVLFVTFALWNWARSRGLEPADERAPFPWSLVLVVFALVLVLRTFEGDWTRAALIAGAVMVAGFRGGASRSRSLWIPGILLGALVGSGWMLSALALALAGFLVLLFSARRP